VLPSNTGAGRERLPGEVQIGQTRRQDRTDVRVAQIVQSGGVVVDASWRDGTTWRDVPTGVKGIVKQTGSNAPLANAVVTIVGSNDSTMTNDDGSFTIAPEIPGKYSISFADTSLREYVPERKTERGVDIVHGQVAESNAELGSFMDVANKVCKGARMTDNTALIAGRIKFPAQAPRGAQVRSQWLANFAPVNNGATVTSGEQIADLDDQNRFIVCGVARDRKIDLRLMAGAQAFSDTSVIAPKGPFLSVSWKPAVRTLASADPGVFIGTVLRIGTTQPVEGAQITVQGVERSATTKSDGTFELTGVPPGEYAVQVRHVGDGLVTDTLRIASGQRVERRFELRRATALDTVRALATRMQYRSSSESAFDERRARGLGTFLMDTLIRKTEGRRLGDVLSGYVPGLRVVTGKAGGQYAIGSRGLGAAAVPTTFGDFLKPGCYVSVYFDGTRLYDPRISGGQGVNLRDYNMTQLARIEYYAGPSQTPPEFGDGPCGVLVLWSREK
jgi:hypothetical protein